MTKTCNTEINGQLYQVCISDEPEALLAAKAAGRAVLGVGEACASFCPWITTVLRSWEDAGENELDKIAELAVGDACTAVSYTHLTLPTICSV